ncbi:hypothetical protein [Nocardioides caricicola]|uniref:Uncharacterized protein n=1 Tax=Nocardioides caricicola TaxID=634770 RepID=A0ABW0MVP4_9ACTN
MNPKLTDDAVSGLPLSHGRAELLEEIMSTPVLDDRPTRDEAPRRRTRWLVPAAAAVVVAALALGTAWWTGQDDAADQKADTTTGEKTGEKTGEQTGEQTGQQERSALASQPLAGHGGRVVLDAPGWEATAVWADKDSGEMSYENGGQNLEIMWGPAKTYEMYVDDRRHIVRPAADGVAITVLGAEAQMWPYSADDHTAIREVENGQWIEVRADGMDEVGYLALLDRLRLVDLAGFEASLPESFVTSAERDDTVTAILDEIDDTSDGPLLPEGVDRTSITSNQVDDYQLGAEISGQVACAWLDEYAAAAQAGDQGRLDAAAAALTSSHDWPVLHRMDERGGYPEVLWSYAQQVADAGVVPEGYAGGLGCEPV